MVIARGRFIRPDNRTGKRLRTNHQIRITPLRLIDENDEQVGVVELEEALRRAREADLDLVEVSPNSAPPVCRVMDYGKWKYQQKKKEHKSRTNAHKSELKGVRLRPKIDTHDLDIKVAKAREFLVEGHKVQFTMLFRGREMAHRELGMRVMKRVQQTLGDVGKVEADARMLGRRMTMVMAPDRSGGKPPEIPQAASVPVAAAAREESSASSPATG